MEEFIIDAMEQMKAISAALGGLSAASILTLVITFVKLCGKKAAAKQSTLALQNRAAELKLVREEKDLIARRLEASEKARAEEQNRTREVVGHLTVAVNYFVAGSRASEECKQSVQNELSAAYDLLPEYSETDTAMITANSERYNAQSNSSKIKAMTVMADAIGELSAAVENKQLKE